MPCQGSQRLRTATAKREITDQPLRVDQTRTEQKADPIGVCLLAQQTLGER